MARQIRLSRNVGENTTKVEVFENGIKVRVQACNNSQEYFADLSQRGIQFPGSTYLDQLNLSVDNLHPDSATALGNPSDNMALVEAMVNQEYFM